MLSSSGMYCSFIYFSLALAWCLTACLIPPRIPFSNISSMSVSVSSTNLNSSGHNSQSLPLFLRSYAHSTQRLSLIRPAMAILVWSKSVLGPACSVLSAYRERSQTRLLTGIQLFLNSYRDSSLGSFSPGFWKLAVHVHGLDH